MDKKTEAVTPDRTAIMSFIKEMKNEELKEEAGILPEDRLMYELASTPQWTALKKYIEKRINNFANLEGFDPVGKDLSEVGLRFIVASLVKAELEKIVKKVETSAEVVKEIKKKNDNKG